MAVADVVEAIVSHRPFRPAFEIQAAAEELFENRDILYDPEVSDACLQIIGRKDFCFEPQ